MSITEAPAGRRVDACLVAGGKYHDIDFARLELLDLLAEHPHVRTRVDATYEDTEALAECSFLVSYTCDVRPSPPAQEAIRSWVQRGGRWLALHGTNAALDLPRPNGVEAPRCFPVWAETLGSQFIAHPPIAPYRVEVAAPDHWLVAGIEPFDTDDELYLMEHADRGALQPLLSHPLAGRGRRVRRERLDRRPGPAPRAVPAPPRRGRRSLQHPRALPGPLGHGSPAGLPPHHRALLVERPPVLRPAAPGDPLGSRRARMTGWKT